MTKKGNAVSAAPKKMKRKHYEKEMLKLQTELCNLQAWVRHKGLRVVVVFEGRDAAGKGGVIKRITERVSPRVFSHGRAAHADRSREDAAVRPAIRPALSGGGRGRAIRSQLVQPGWR